MNDIETRIVSLLADERGVKSEKIKRDSRLLEDLGMDGDDACEFFERFGSDFGVNLANMQWDRHFDPEVGANLFAVFTPSFWKRNPTHCPITVEDLIASAKAREWRFDYSSR